MSRKTTGRGRSVEALVGRLRSEIVARHYPHGGLLPSTRKLAERFSTSYETVRRGLKRLEVEGLLRSEAKLGFRVSEAPAASQACPIAYITEFRMDLSDAQPSTWALSVAFQDAAARRGWSVLAAHGGGRDYGEVVEQIRSANARGIALDTLDERLYAAVLGTGLPVVMVNSWFEDCAVDVVLQDNYRGGFLAAEHMVKHGARRVAWIGPTAEYCHSRERFAGAAAALSIHGLGLASADVVRSSEDPRETVRRLLGRGDRPDGILAFNYGDMGAVGQVAGELGLRIGRDFQAVGWTVEDCYETHYRSMFGGGAVPPAVVWSAREMAERAMALLTERSQGKGGRPLRICVGTPLRFAERNSVG